MFNAESGITLQAGGKIILDAKGGVVNKSSKIDITAASKPKNTDSVQSERKAADVKVTPGAAAGANSKSNATTGAGEATGIKDDKSAPASSASDGKGDSKDIDDQKQDVVEDSEIIEVYWTYGESFTDLGKRGDVCISKYYDDLNLHVMTKPGNDGKKAIVTVKHGDQKTTLDGIVSDSSMVFEKVFVKYITR
jgi:hypothetical protein